MKPTIYMNRNDLMDHHRSDEDEFKSIGMKYQL